MLTGAGKTLSAGGDVDQIRYIIDNPRVFYAAMVNAKRIIGNILDCPKPIIFHRAMINPLFTPKRMAEMEHSVQYREVYGIPRFFVMEEQQFDARVGELRGKMKLRIALANVDGVELELIEPASPGIDAIYRDVLPANGVHTNVFHHICVKVNGTLDDWDRHLAELPKDRPIYYDGDVGPGARFVYTDDRALLGHYIEHV